MPAAVGLVAGLLGGLLGIGGSVIIIPGLIFYLGQTGGYGGAEQHLIQAAAMICNVFVAAPSVVAHYRAGAIVRPIVVFLIPAALIGVDLGVRISNSSLFARENGAWLGMILAGFLAYVAVYNAVRMFRPAKPDNPLETKRPAKPWAVIAVGFPAGFVGGLLGIGGGAICVPLQQIFLKVPLRRAIANSAATIVCSAVYGSIRKNATLPEHGFDVTDSLQLAAMLIPTAIFGSYLGGRLTHMLPRNVLRLVFVGFMLFVSYVTYQEAREAIAARGLENRFLSSSNGKRQAVAHQIMLLAYRRSFIHTAKPAGTPDAARRIAPRGLPARRPPAGTPVPGGADRWARRN